MELSNADMKPNRFGRWAECRVLYSRITNHLKDGGTVMVCTYTKATQYEPKHVGMFRCTKTGVLVQRGKSWDCIDGCAIRYWK